MRCLAAVTLLICLGCQGPLGGRDNVDASDPIGKGSAPPCVRDDSPTHIDPTLRALAEEKLEIAKRGYELVMQLWERGHVRQEELAVWARRRLESELDLATAKAERVAAYELYLERVASDAETARLWMNVGRTSHVDVLAADYHELEVKLMLARCKAE